ncbi:hypothetical protein ACQJBY_006000 [Aegilops geniculata]
MMLLPFILGAVAVAGRCCRSRSVSTRSCRAMSCVSGKPAAGRGSTKETRGSGDIETEGDAHMPLSHMLDPPCRSLEFFEHEGDWTGYRLAMLNTLPLKEVRPRRVWQSHEEERGLCIMKSSSWFLSEFPLLKMGFHVEEVWNVICMEILMKYDDGDMVRVDLMESGRAGGGGCWTRMHKLCGSISHLDSNHRFLPFLMLPTRPLLGVAPSDAVAC